MRKQISALLLVLGGICAIGVGCGSSGTTGIIGDGGVNPAGCPATMPSTDGACALASGASCSYGCNAGGPGSATCESGKWRIAFSDIACVPEDAGGPIACGSTTCGATQYCVQPCCGGAEPACEPLPDSGICPPNTHQESCGCQPDPCKPPPAFCVDDPKTQPGCQSFDPKNPRVLSCLCA